LPLLSDAPAAAQASRKDGGAFSRALPPVRPAELGPSTEQLGMRPAAAPVGAAPPASEQAKTLPAGREASCLAALKAIPGNSVEAADPKLAQGDPACRVDEPVIVKALALRATGTAGAGTVTFAPPVTLSCVMAKTVAGWLDDSVRPLARGHFDSDLTELRVGGGHECRRRNRASAGPVSEHATGKALDIFAFHLGEGKAATQVSVEKPAGLAQNRFLTAVRQSACGAFMTALGPGSDAAHANHLHIDIQERRTHASRFCQ
jgi:hypothetical protein